MRVSTHSKMRYPWLPYFFMDFLSITVAYYLTLLFRFRSGVGRHFYDWVTHLLLEQPAGRTDEALAAFYHQSAFRIILILTAVICLLYALRHLYAGRRFLLPQPVTWNVLVCNLIALAAFYFYWYLTRNTYHPRSLFATLILLNVLLCPLLRALMGYVLGVVRQRWGVDRCAAVLIGVGDEADLLEKLLTRLRPHGIYYRARLVLSAKESFSSWLEQVRASIVDEAADMLIVADLDLEVPQIMQVLELASETGVSVKILSARLDVLITEARLPCDVLRGVPLVHFSASSLGGGHPGPVRRGLSVFCAGCVLVLAAPLMLLLAGIIRVTSPGPAVFRQKRIGINRKPFYIYKFRTMHHLAEEALASIESENENREVLFKIRRDPRITSVGGFLRRFSLDELPQLINVVRGEMALVGPRPLPERDFERYEEDWHYIRHDGLPGLTCLWQISGRSNLNFHHMCILDIYYLRNHSWVMDLSIALQTIRTVLFGIGAY